MRFAPFFAAAAAAASSAPSRSPQAARRLAFLGRPAARRAAAANINTTSADMSSAAAAAAAEREHGPRRILDSPSAERNKGPILAALRSDVVPLLLKPSSSSSLAVLEVAAGCGVHTLHLARGLADDGAAEAAHTGTSSGGGTSTSVTWYPTDPSPTSRQSIDARAAAAAADASLSSAVTVMPARSLTLDAEGILEGRTSNDADADDNGAVVVGTSSSSSPSALSQLSELPDPVADLAPASLDLVVNINMIHISPWAATQGLMKISSELLRSGGVLYCYGPYKVGGTAAESNLRFDESLKSRNMAWGVRDLEDVAAEAERWGLRLVHTVEMPANNLSVIYQKQ
jgi:SAM-dependent methyltransferase